MNGTPPTDDPKAARNAALDQLRIEQFKYYLEEQRELWLSGREWAIMTVRLLLTANGGAVVALLALLGALAKANTFDAALGKAMLGLVSFGLGVLAATVSAGASTFYFANLWRAFPRTEHVEKRVTELIVMQSEAVSPFNRDDSLRKKSETYLAWSVSAALASALLFVCGALLTARAFMPIAAH